MDKMKELFIALNEKPIAYHRIYTKITKSLTSGVLLSQLIYWGSTRDYREFYKTNKEIGEETGLAEWEVKKAKLNLKKLNLITITLKSLPRKTYYTINIDNIISLITSWSYSLQQERLNETNKIDLSNSTTSETTTKNTPDNTKEYKHIKTELQTIPVTIFQKIELEYSKETRQFIEFYISRYNNFWVNNHPPYSKELLLKCAEHIFDRITELDLDLDFWKEMVESYFNNYIGHNKIDCHLAHFCHNPETGIDEITIFYHRSR